MAQAWIQFGCGLSAPHEWRNFDSSPMLRLQRVPLLGHFVPSGPFGRFPANVEYGDVVAGLPIAADSAELVYCSHVLEHLSLKDLRIALKNSHKMLASGGRFRMVLPDLEFLARSYLDDSSDTACSGFMEETMLGTAERKRGLRQFVREWLGNSRHLWMWDYKGLAKELSDSGFRSIRRAQYNDSSETGFQLVESAERWVNALGIECTK